MLLNAGQPGQLFCGAFGFCSPDLHTPTSGDRLKTSQFGVGPNDASFDADTHEFETRWNINDSLSLDYLFGSWKTDEEVLTDFDAVKARAIPHLAPRGVRANHPRIAPDLGWRRSCAPHRKLECVGLGIRDPPAQLHRLCGAQRCAGPATDLQSLRANLGLLDAEYDKFEFRNAAGLQDLSGLELRSAREVSRSVSATCELTNDSQHLVDAALNYQIGQLQISAFGHNLLDEDGCTIGFDVAGLWSYAGTRPPRTFGIEVNYVIGQQTLRR